MTTQKVVLADLSEPIQQFLNQIGPGKAVVVEDESGRACYGIIPYQEATEQEQARALADLRKLQKEIGDRSRALGRSEAELDQILTDDEP
jgi:antitoxin (DNA-binding transcriptional repressor) of toxin-antitoxin stability system